MAYRPPYERMEDVERAWQMREQGMTISSIANALGLARTTVSNYINHPETGKLYRKRLRQWQMCPRCGGRMSYGAKQCKKCRYN